jgi:hypothetical protein
MDNIETITTEMSYSIGSEADIDLEKEKPENTNTKINNEDLTKKFGLRNFIYPIQCKQKKKEKIISKMVIFLMEHIIQPLHIFIIIL